MPVCGREDIRGETVTVGIFVDLATQQERARARYALSHLMDILGYSFTFLDEESGADSPAPVLIHYGEFEGGSPATACVTGGGAVIRIRASGFLSGDTTPSCMTDLLDVGKVRQATVFHEPAPVPTTGANRRDVLYEFGDGSAAVVAYKMRGSHDICIEMNADVVGCTFYLVSRLEERNSSQTDEHGRYRSQASVLARDSLMDSVPVGEYAFVLRGLLGLCLKQERIVPLSKWPWPYGHAMAACLTHDIDDTVVGPRKWLSSSRVFRGLRSSRSTEPNLIGTATGRSPGQSTTRAKRVLRHIRLKIDRLRVVCHCAARALLDGPGGIASVLRALSERYGFVRPFLKVEKGFGFKSSFYLLGGPKNCFYGTTNTIASERIRRIMQVIEAAGSEVGLHGSYEAFRDADQLAREKMVLETQLGREVAGNRQHYLCLSVDETWRVLESTGLQYDSSLGYNKRPGYRAGTPFPFEPYIFSEEKPARFLEVSLVLMDATLFSQHRVVEHDPWEESLTQIDACHRFNGLITLNWHNTRACGIGHFRKQFEIYGRLLELLAKKNAWGTGGREITEWWNRRRLAHLTWKGQSGAWAEYTVSVEKTISGLTLCVPGVDKPGDLQIKVDSTAIVEIIQLGPALTGIVLDRIAPGCSVEIAIARRNWFKRK